MSSGLSGKLKLPGASLMRYEWAGFGALCGKVSLVQETLIVVRCIHFSIRWGIVMEQKQQAAPNLASDTCLMHLIKFLGFCCSSSWNEYKDPAGYRFAVLMSWLALAKKVHVRVARGCWITLPSLPLQMELNKVAEKHLCPCNSIKCRFIWCTTIPFHI